MAEKGLSESQVKALAIMDAAGGALVRQFGGYWVAPDRADGLGSPEEYVSTLTIYALESKGLIRAASSTRANWTRVERIKAPDHV